MTGGVRLPDWSNSIAATLKTIYAGAGWQDVFGALVGATLFKWLSGFTSLTVGWATGVKTLIGNITGAITAGGNTFTTALRTQAAAVWDAMQVGLFGYPVNVAWVLVAFMVVVALLGVIRDG